MGKGIWWSSLISLFLLFSFPAFADDPQSVSTSSVSTSSISLTPLEANLFEAVYRFRGLYKKVAIERESLREENADLTQDLSECQDDVSDSYLYYSIAGVTGLTVGVLLTFLLSSFN